VESGSKFRKVDSNKKNCNDCILEDTLQELQHDLTHSALFYSVDVKFRKLIPLSTIIFLHNFPIF
jgi:hypothetical protein